MEQLDQVQTVDKPAFEILFSRLNQAIERDPRPWACALVAAGFLVRIFRASGTYLNPDEAMHLSAASQPTWWLAYKASLTLAHPPLLVFLLHFWRRLGSSELIFRMPLILAGTAACWLAYRWLARLSGEGVSAAVLVFMLFLPSPVELSTEIRQYALLLAFEVGAAYLLEVALAENSVSAMLGSGLCLSLALASHYSAFLVALVLGTYAVIRMLHQHPPMRVFAAWEIGQIAAFALCYFLYVTHLAQLGRNFGGVNAFEGFMGSEYLGHSYFVPGKTNPWVFALARTGGVFQYLFGQFAVGDLAYVAFLIGVVLVFRQWRRGIRGPGELAWLLVFPFAAGCAAALARAYPYGGTRHSFFLLPFALCGVAIAILAAVKGRIAGGILTALVVALICNLIPSVRSPHISAENQRKRHMYDAIDFLRHIEPGAPIFVDDETRFMLENYLCPLPVALDQGVEGFVSFDCGGHRVIVARQFIFSPRSFCDAWRLMLSRYRLLPGSKVWVAQMGWSPYLAVGLSRFPELQLEPHYFGENLQVFELTAGQKMPAPERLPTS